MLTEGRLRYERDQQRNIAKGQRGDTSAGRTIVSGGIDRVSEGLTAWLQDQWVKYNGSKGRKTQEYLLLAEMDPAAAAAIALRITLNCLTHVASFAGVAVKVGKALEQELRAKALRETSPKLHKWAADKIKKSGDARYKRRVMTWTANRAGVTWTPWPEDLHLRMGAVMLAVIHRSVGIIDICKRPTSGRRCDDTLYVQANAGTLAWIKAHDLAAQLASPVYLPTIVPPRPWTSPTSGGYWSDKLPALTLVKTRNKHYLKELANHDLSAVYASVNTLQETAWQINADVLRVLGESWGDALAGLPLEQEVTLPSKPADIETNETARQAYRQEMAQAWERRFQQRSERVHNVQIATVARRFVGYERIYFPHQLDFRGRVYAIPGALNPQGSDMAKGLLRFAEGKPLDASGYRWLMIHGANTAGVDKVSFDERVAWVASNHERLLATARDPHADRWWSDLDSPWMFLAFVFEYAGYHEAAAEGRVFVSRLPVMLDGSCSGLQHFSAMLRDPVAAASVNLVPAERPQDIYGDVAKVAMEKLKVLQESEELLPGRAAITVGEAARRWLAFGVTRKTTKRNVMTLPYGATAFSHRQFVMEHLEERIAAGEAAPVGTDGRMEFCRLLADVIWDSIGEVVQAARVAMTWLQEAAREVSRDGLSISWIAPSGFPVLQAYRKYKDRRVALFSGEKIMRIRLQHETDELDRHKQSSGISPNFVHSMDAAALVAAVNEARGRGIGAVACVHDSFGTHAADTEGFAQAIRDSFVSMYETNDVLADLRESLENEGVTLPPLPLRGTLDIRQVGQSVYCFA
jgi:DNA-directed RNA polymerase